MGEHTHKNPIMDYIIIQPVTPDGTFVSAPIHAVVTPGLCMPIILGLPFLTENKIVYNYAKYTCMVTHQLPAYNLLKSSLEMIPLMIKEPNILGMIIECIHVLENGKNDL